MAPTATADLTSPVAHAKLSYDSFSNVINSKLLSTSKTRHGINPATKTPNWEVPVATPADLDAAVDAGKIAFKKWKNVPYDERRKAVLAFADALEAAKEDFAKLLTTEQGKPVST
jgi:acyl-CoA reductase-like NAD-dependent aldehyde dehydrogenase